MVVVLLARGVKQVWICADEVAVRRRYTGRELLVGERGGLKLDGFEYGNSPSVLNEARMANRTALLCTSGLSPAVLALAGAPVLLVGSTLNASAVAKVMCEIGGEWALVGAAAAGVFRAEDKVGCMLIGERYRRIVLPREGIAGTSGARVGFAYVRRVIRRSASGRYLTEIGAEADVEFAATRVDTYDLVPFCRLREADAVMVEVWDGGRRGVSNASVGPSAAGRARVSRSW